MYCTVKSSMIVKILTGRKLHSLARKNVFNSSCCSYTYSKRKVLHRQQKDAISISERRYSDFVIEQEKFHSFVKDFYVGKINLQLIFPYPTLENSKDLQSFNDSLKPIHDFFEKNEINCAKLDEDAEIPKELIEELKKLRLFGLMIPEKYGGLELTNMKSLKIFEDIASADLSTHMMIASHNLLGVQTMLEFGTEEQKRKYLPKMATGEMIAAFCCNEASCGSDINTMETRARLDEDGEYWIITGEKTSINNADIADLMIVFAKTEVIDMEDVKKDTIVAFIVERNFGGMYTGPQEDKMGMRALNTSDVMFDDTPVPVANVLGEVGQGFKIATHTMNYARTFGGVGQGPHKPTMLIRSRAFFRMLGLAAGVMGPLRTAVSGVTMYTNRREQFGKRLSDFELVRERTFQMSQNIYVMESVAYLTMGKYDQAIEEKKIPDLSVEFAITKVLLAQLAFENASECIEMVGHRAYTKSLPFERLLRDTKMLTLSEGPSDVLKLYIALSCFQSAEKFLSERMRRIRRGSMREMYSSFMDMWKDERSTEYVKKGFLRKQIPSFGLTTESRTENWLDPRLRETAQLIEETELSFYRKVFGHIKHYGNTLNDQQLRLRRFADLTIAMYSMAAVLARCNKSLLLGIRDYDREFLFAVAYIWTMFRKCGLMLEELEGNFNMNVDNRVNRVGRELLEEQRYLIAHPLELEHKYVENPIYLEHLKKASLLKE